MFMCITNHKVWDYVYRPAYMCVVIRCLYVCQLFISWLPYHQMTVESINSHRLYNHFTSRYVPALRQLRQMALVLNFPQTEPARLASRLVEVVRIEQLKADLNALMALCERTDNDIRSCLNTLQVCCLSCLFACLADCLAVCLPACLCLHSCKTIIFV